MLFIKGSLFLLRWEKGKPSSSVNWFISLDDQLRCVVVFQLHTADTRVLLSIDTTEITKHSKRAKPTVNGRQYKYSWQFFTELFCSFCDIVSKPEHQLSLYWSLLKWTALQLLSIKSIFANLNAMLSLKAGFTFSLKVKVV